MGPLALGLAAKLCWASGLEKVLEERCSWLSFYLIL
jgi:hypothetical protein